MSFGVEPQRTSSKGSRPPKAPAAWFQEQFTTRLAGRTPDSSRADTQPGGREIGAGPLMSWPLSEAGGFREDGCVSSHFGAKNLRRKLIRLIEMLDLLNNVNVLVDRK